LIRALPALLPVWTFRLVRLLQTLSPFGASQPLHLCGSLLPIWSVLTLETLRRI
jgi:hypothetical protein